MTRYILAILSMLIASPSMAQDTPDYLKAAAGVLMAKKECGLSIPDEFVVYFITRGAQQYGVTIETAVGIVRQYIAYMTPELMNADTLAEFCNDMSKAQGQPV